MIDEISSAIIVGVLKKVWDFLKDKFSDKKAPTDVENVASRFIQLFEKHGIHRNQIPRFFGHKLTLADVADQEKLITKLTHNILQSASDLFAVRLEWLEGVDATIYEAHDFYKHPENYRDFLARLAAGNEHRIIAKLVLSTDPSSEQDALLVLEEQFAFLGDEPVVRYHLCNGWVNKYWKCRADLTACIAMTLNQPVFIKERRTTANIQAFCDGEGFMDDLFALPLAFKRSGFFQKHYQQWHPDQWIFDPESFLDGVDEGAFGKKSALKRWLNYYDQGYMETGYQRRNVRDEFALKLEQLVDNA
jgi:hypothetical protein